MLGMAGPGEQIGHGGAQLGIATTGDLDEQLCRVHAVATLVQVDL